MILALGPETGLGQLRSGWIFGEWLSYYFKSKDTMAARYWGQMGQPSHLRGVHSHVAEARGGGGGRGRWSGGGEPWSLLPRHVNSCLKRFLVRELFVTVFKNLNTNVNNLFYFLFLLWFYMYLFDEACYFVYQRFNQITVHRLLKGHWLIVKIQSKYIFGGSESYLCGWRTVFRSLFLEGGGDSAHTR